jgi:uncharacterized protein YndB with AHSA1/START domain
MAELQIVRTFDAQPERVWSAFTTADGLAGWIWPESWQAVAEVDLQVGGSYRITSAPNDMAVAGEFVEIDAPYRLAETWQWEGDDGRTILVVALASSATGGTDLTLEHGGFTSDEDRDNHIQGWNDCLDRLPGYLES